MQMVLLVIALFFALCFCYGLYAGVAAIVRGAHGVRTGFASDTTAAPVPCQAAGPDNSPQPEPPRPTPRSLIAELQLLTALHEKGGLTEKEFELLKAHILSGIFCACQNARAPGADARAH